MGIKNPSAVTINFKDGKSITIHTTQPDIDRLNGYIHVSGTNQIINADIIKDIVIRR